MYAFNYQRPTDVSAAASAAVADTDSRFLAGGQSLVQAMKLRLSQPSALIDLGGVAALAGITVTADTVSIGAMTRHDQVARSAEVARAIPALAALAGGIGDPMIRNAGTLGGSLAHADPAACYPSAIVGLGATVRTDRRSIPGDQFFTGLFETALAAGELVPLRVRGSPRFVDTITCSSSTTSPSRGKARMSVTSSTASISWLATIFGRTRVSTSCTG